MTELSKWLMHDDRKELFEILVACAMNVLFLAVTALLLWPLGRPALAFSLAKGYFVLWIVTIIAVLVAYRIQHFFRVNLYEQPDAYVISNLAVSCFLQVGWSAFAALTVPLFVVSTPVWIAVVVYLVGALSCLVAYFAVSSFYQGHIYKFISLPLAFACFVVFSVWPAGGRALYGWFFDLF